MQNILSWITANEQMFYIVILMIFVGIEVIGRVPSVLHTPLMSGANAIHGVVVIGAIIVMGKAEADNYFALILGFLAVVLGTLNVVGGFVVTDRMLEMFKRKRKQKQYRNSNEGKKPISKFECGKQFEEKAKRVLISKFEWRKRKYMIQKLGQSHFLYG